MVSEFRKKKLLHVFNFFFDTDKSGSVEEIDFILAIDKIAELRGWKEGAQRYEEAKKIAVVMWEGLQLEADKDNDGTVTADEWIQLWDDYAKNPNSVKDWQVMYCRFIFQLEDASSDEKIDEDEFSSVYQSFGMKKEESVEAFKKMSRGKAEVTWSEFKKLWEEYFTTEDEDAPGNFIFGLF